MADMKDESPTTTEIVHHKRPGIPVKVRVTLPAGNGQARIESKDGKIDMLVSTGMVRKRMRAGETSAYFIGALRDHGTLEIGERIEQW